MATTPNIPTTPPWREELDLTGHWLHGGVYLWFCAEKNQWYIQPLGCEPYYEPIGTGSPEHLDFVRQGRWQALCESLGVQAEPSPFTTLPCIEDMAKVVFFQWLREQTDDDPDYDEAPFDNIDVDDLNRLLDKYDAGGDRNELEQARAAVLEQADKYRQRYLSYGRRFRQRFVENLERGTL